MALSFQGRKLAFTSRVSSFKSHWTFSKEGLRNQSFWSKRRLHRKTDVKWRWSAGVWGWHGGGLEGHVEPEAPKGTINTKQNGPSARFHFARILWVPL